MKTLLAIIILLASCSLAEASAGYVQVAGYPGWYRYYDAAGNHDGWNYRVRCYCGKTSYYKHSRIEISIQQSVTYTKDWKSDMVKALDRAKDTELFLAAIRESGLSVAGSVAVGGSSYDSVRGYSTYQQGYQPYAQQGSTLYGLSSYAPNIGQVNIEALLHAQARITDRLQENTVISNHVLADRIGQVSSAQLEIAKIQEAGKAMVAAIQAASPPISQTHSWEASRGSTPPQPNGYAASAPPPDGGVLVLVKAQDVMNRNCISCHGPTKQEKGLDLSNFSNWNQETAELYGPKIVDRVTTSDPLLRMPKDHPQLNAADLKVLFDVLVE